MQKGNNNVIFLTPRVRNLRSLWELGNTFNEASIKTGDATSTFHNLTKQQREHIIYERFVTKDSHKKNK